MTAASSDVKGKLFLSGSAYGTSVSAAAAAYAIVSVDNVLTVALGDAAGRASISASAARNALIGNLISHLENLQKIISIYILAYLFEKSRGFSKKVVKSAKIVLLFLGFLRIILLAHSDDREVGNLHELLGFLVA